MKKLILFSALFAFFAANPAPAQVYWQIANAGTNAVIPGNTLTFANAVSTVNSRMIAVEQRWKLDNSGTSDVILHVDASITGSSWVNDALGTVTTAATGTTSITNINTFDSTGYLAVRFRITNTNSASVTNVWLAAATKKGVEPTALLEVLYGGTGTNTLAHISWPTNEAANAFNLGNLTVKGYLTNTAWAYLPTNTAANAYNSGNLTVAGYLTNTAWAYLPTNTAPAVLNEGTLTVAGVLTAGSTLSAPTNTANFSTDTNELVSGRFRLLRNQRGTATVNVTTTTSDGGVQYSNAASGIIRTLFVPVAASNIVTIRFQPNSMIAVTNGTVIPNTTSINYE